MNYLALGDSISIDDYTNVAGGGAVSQFAHLVGAKTVQDLTRDGHSTPGVLESLSQVNIEPNIVTLTAGGNDLLQSSWLALQAGTNPRTILAQAAQQPLANLAAIADHLAAFGCPVILNTVYDPTDGNDALAEQLGLTPEWRTVFDQINDGIKTLAAQHGFLLADLETLFHGHGIAARKTWITMQIEPNFAGATAIAHHWYQLYQP